MERQKKIIDASVAVKLFAKEEGSEIAVKLRDRHINGEIVIVVPELFFMEILNALRYKKLSEEVLDKANKDLWKVQFEVISLDEFILDKAIKASVDYGLTIYDGIYAALSQIYGTELITDDKKLLKIPNAVSLKEMVKK
jgi:predicted nucleic acid-binding protein